MTRRAHAWLRDLSLGLQFAFRGARVRTALTATGIGLAVGVLMFAASLPGAIEARQQRDAARNIWGDQLVVSDSSGQTTSALTKPSDDSALVSDVATIWQGDRILGIVMRPEGSSPPLPPGVSRVPGPGEIVVSPALARTLRDDDAALLRERLGNALIIGTIADEGLSGPQEHRWYGYADIDDRAMQSGGTSINRIAAFGAGMPDPQLDVFLRVMVLIGAITLLFPIAILVGTAARFGSERRDRRLAALRLVGTSRAETGRIAAGESLAGALLGIAGGAALFAAARLVLPHVEAFGFSLYTSDARPDPLLALAVIGGVVAVAIGTTVLSMRRVAVEPLAVTRRGRGPRRRFWWRPLPVIAGFAVLYPVGRHAPDAAGDHPWQVGIGAVLMLVGVVSLLPWAVDASVARLRGWSVSSQLAVRTLQSDGAGAARIVSGVAVAVAGAITLQMLLTAEATQPQAIDESKTAATAYLPATLAELPRVRDGLARVPGVRSVAVSTNAEVTGHGGGNGLPPNLTIGDCAALNLLAVVPDCDDRAGGVYRAVFPTGEAPESANPRTAVPQPGERVKLRLPSDGDDHWHRFALPETTETVPARVKHYAGYDEMSLGIYATPGALSLPDDLPLGAQFSAELDPADPLALERLRTAAAQISPLANVYEPYAQQEAATESALHRMLLAGAALLLLLISASLLVTTLEQLGERRRSLAALSAVGTPRATLRRSLWWQTAVPVTIGLALAVTIGTALGAVLLKMQDEPVQLDLSGTAGLLAIGAGMVVAVTAISLPLLRRVAAPSAIRAE